MVERLWALAAATLAAAATTVALASPAAAQDRARPAPVVVELPTTTIVGTQQRPGALYVLSRTRAGYEVTELRASFVREVVRSTEAEPF